MFTQVQLLQESERLAKQQQVETERMLHQVTQQSEHFQLCLTQEQAKTREKESEIHMLQQQVSESVHVCNYYH